MVRRLDMHKTQGIEHLFATGMSKRKIARTLGIDRKSVDRHLVDIQSKGAKALTGSEASDLSGIGSLKPASKPDRSRSQCSQFKQQILAKIEQGLTAQRIYQDLVSDYGFNASLLSEHADIRRVNDDVVLCWPKGKMHSGDPPLKLRLVRVKIGKTKM